MKRATTLASTEAAFWREPGAEEDARAVARINAAARERGPKAAERQLLTEVGRALRRKKRKPCDKA